MIVSPTVDGAEAAAVCSIGESAKCRWHTLGTEEDVSRQAEDHARAKPGHRVTCAVKQTWTWSVVEPP